MLVRRKHRKEDGSNSAQDVLLYATVQRCQWLQRGVVQVYAMYFRCKPHQRGTGGAKGSQPCSESLSIGSDDG